MAEPGRCGAENGAHVLGNEPPLAVDLDCREVQVGGEGEVFTRARSPETSAAPSVRVLQRRRLRRLRALNVPRATVARRNQFGG